MEYFIGSVVTIVLTTFLFLAVRQIPKERAMIVKTSQSRQFELLDRHLISLLSTSPKPSQTTKHEQSSMLRVFVLKDKAYWIKNNKVFTAEIVDSEINSEEGVEVDMMSMSDVQLKEMLFIIDQLKEDTNNDNWNPGKPQL